MVEAKYYSKLKQNVIKCTLCPHFCVIKPDETGLCQSRRNINGALFAVNYQQLCTRNIDPIEKKPLYHFLPGSSILSLGNNGCNLKCKFCQNWEISQQTIETTSVSPEQIVKHAKTQRIPSVAFTYAEPMIWYEYVIDTCRLLQSEGIRTVLVTNGFINPDPLRELVKVVDAMNIDIKAMSDDFYRSLCTAKLQPVLDACCIVNTACHLEITYLIIPSENDDESQFAALAEFISSFLSRSVPLHLSRYHPSYKMRTAPTPYETMFKAYKLCKEHLDYVYIGNVPELPTSETLCLFCGKRLIRRSGYRVDELNIDQNGNCLACGNHTTIRL